jgi:hypothetical protein
MDWIDLGLVAVICLAIGFISASLINNLRNGESPPKQIESSDEDDRVEILRLLRGPDGGPLQLELAKKPLKSAALLSDEQHAQLSLAVVDLYAWLEEGNQPAPKLEKPLAPRKAAVTASGPGEAKKPVKAPSLNVFKALTRTAQTEATQKIEAPRLSLAAEIDDILQEKLSGSPLAEKGIRLMDLPKQGMVIMIGLDKYPDVDAVPDEAIKSLLHEAVAEWEARALSEGRLE